MAKTIDVRVPHTFELDAAKERIQALGDYFAARHGANVHWEGDTARVMGAHMLIKLDVSVDVEAKSVRLETRDPGMLLRKQMRGYAERKLLAYLDPATKPEDLVRS